MAKLLEKEVSSIPGVKVVRPVQANGVFAELPTQIIPKLQAEHFFYVWSDTASRPGYSEVRWMCSFDTQESDIRAFAQAIRSLIS